MTRFSATFFVPLFVIATTAAPFACRPPEATSGPEIPCPLEAVGGPLRIDTLPSVAINTLPTATIGDANARITPTPTLNERAFTLTLTGPHTFKTGVPWVGVLPKNINDHDLARAILPRDSTEHQGPKKEHRPAPGHWFELPPDLKPPSLSPPAPAWKPVVPQAPREDEPAIAKGGEPPGGGFELPWTPHSSSSNDKRDEFGRYVPTAEGGEMGTFGDFWRRRV